MNAYSTTAALINYPSAAQLAVSPFVIVSATGALLDNARTLAVGRALLRADERGNARRAYGTGSVVMSRKNYERQR